MASVGFAGSGLLQLRRASAQQFDQIGGVTEATVDQIIRIAAVKFNPTLVTTHRLFEAAARAGNAEQYEILGYAIM